MRKNRLIVFLICALVMALVLCGCQATPEHGAVTSKNDGTYEAALQNNVSPTFEPATAAPETTAETSTNMEQPQQPATYTDSFTNASGDVTINLSFQEPIINTAQPVIQVRPMEFSGEQVQKIAAAIFGNEPVYENTQQMSKAEIEAAILELRQTISDWSGMLSYYGGDETLAQSVKDDYERRIASLELSYQNAPDGIERTACSWQFHSDDYYMSPEQASNFVDEGHRYIKASAMVNGLPYTLTACNREATDYRIHDLSVGLDDTVLSYDDLKNISTAAPTKEDLQAMAQEMIAKMDIGQWAPASDDEVGLLGFSSNDSSSNFRTIAYTRVYDGIRATLYEGGLTKADAYASNYYYESLTFLFCGDVLYRFEYMGPLQVVAAVNQNVQTLPFNDILSAAKQQMQMFTPEQLMLPDGNIVVDVGHIEWGLSRIRIRDNATDFYLTPTCAFFGTAKAYDANGQVIKDQWMDPDGTTHEQQAQCPVLLAVVNAVDGSIIDTQQGY